MYVKVRWEDIPIGFLYLPTTPSLPIIFSTGRSLWKGSLVSSLLSPSKMEIFDTAQNLAKNLSGFMFHYKPDKRSRSMHVSNEPTPNIYRCQGRFYHLGWRFVQNRTVMNFYDQMKLKLRMYFDGDLELCEPKKVFQPQEN